MRSYAVNANALALDPDDNFCALPLLDAADAAHTSCVDAPVGGSDGLWQRSQREGRANLLVGRHCVRQVCRALRCVALREG